MADANRTSVAYVAESVWGTNPGTALTELPYTGESLTIDLSKQTSKTIRSDRQKTGSRRMTFNASGGVNFEVTYGDFDPFLESAFFSSFSTAPANILAKSDVAVYQASGVGGRPRYMGVTSTVFNASQWAVGHWVYVTGFTTSNNNGWKRIVAIGSDYVDVDSPVTMTNEAAGDTVNFYMPDVLRNGTTQKSFTIERAHLDVAQYFGYFGMIVNTFGINFTANSFATGDMTFQGKNGTLGQVTNGTGSNNAVTGNESMNSVSNIGQVMVDNAIVDTALLQALSFQINNNLRARNVIAATQAASVGAGAFDVTGTLNMHFLDETFYDKWLNDTAFGLSMKLEDASSNVYIIDFPKCEFTANPGPNAGGENQDCMENASFGAFRHSSTQDYTAQICRMAVGSLPTSPSSSPSTSPSASTSASPSASVSASPS